MTILIPIETSSRELTYKTYLCHLLALKGFTCYLGTKKNISYLIKRFDGYIYLDKGYHLGVSDKIYEIIKRKNGLIVNLDEEGAIDFPDGSTLRNRYTKKLFDASERVFLWGNYQYDLVKHLVSDNQKVIVSGHPRFELLKQPYHYLYNSEVHRLRKRFGDFILINTNFGFGNNIKGDNFVFTNYSSRFVNIKDIIAFDKIKTETYLSLVHRLIQETKLHIIFRPHPEEDQTIYKDAFINYDNVTVINEGSVVPWLLSSDIMIHPDCTTSIESLMLGKKSISYLPLNYNENLVTKLPLNLSFRITNLDDLVKFIGTKRYKENSTFKNDFKLIENYFSFSKNTSQLIVDEITNLMSSISQKSKSRLTTKEKIKMRLSSIKHELTQRFSSSKEINLYKNKLAGFSFRNIKALHEKIENLIDQDTKVNIENTSAKLFVFSKFK